MRTTSAMLLFVLGTLITHAQSTFVLSPLPTALGNYQGTGPFLVDQRLASSFRYQQVYAASDFSGRGPRILITKIRFDSADGINIDANLTDIRINFSTTPRAPDGLSGVFADNVGADNMVAFSGPLH